MQFLKSRRRKKRKNILRARADNEPDPLVHAQPSFRVLGVAPFGPWSLALGRNPLTAAQLLLHQRISLAPNPRVQLQQFSAGLIKRCVFVAIAANIFLLGVARSGKLSKLPMWQALRVCRLTTNCSSCSGNPKKYKKKTRKDNGKSWAENGFVLWPGVFVQSCFAVIFEMWEQTITRHFWD